MAGRNAESGGRSGDRVWNWMQLLATIASSGCTSSCASAAWAAPASAVACDPCFGDCRERKGRGESIYTLVQNSKSWYKFKPFSLCL